MDTNAPSTKTMPTNLSGAWKSGTRMSTVDSVTNHVSPKTARKSDDKTSALRRHGALATLTRIIMRKHKKRVGDNDGLTDF